MPAPFASLSLSAARLMAHGTADFSYSIMNESFEPEYSWAIPLVNIRAILQGESHLQLTPLHPSSPRLTLPSSPGTFAHPGSGRRRSPARSGSAGRHDLDSPPPKKITTTESSSTRNNLNLSFDLLRQTLQAVHIGFLRRPSDSEAFLFVWFGDLLRCEMR